MVLRDVTARSAVEDMLVEMTENQLGMISQVGNEWPQHDLRVTLAVPACP